MRRSADCEQLALRIGRRTLERELSRLLRRGIDAPVVFDPRMDLSARAVSGWAATLGFVLDEIRRGTGSLDHPLVRSRVEQLLIDQLLVAQRHTFSEELQTGHRPARPPTVRRAVEIIQASSGRSIASDYKFPRFILNGGFDAGFAIRLMLKDVDGYARLAQEGGVPSFVGRAASEIYRMAVARLIEEWAGIELRSKPGDPA